MAEELEGGGTPSVKHGMTIKRRNTLIMTGVVGVFGLLIAGVMMKNNAEQSSVLASSIDKPKDMPQDNKGANDRMVQGIVQAKNVAGAHKNDFSPVLIGSIDGKGSGVGSDSTIGFGQNGVDGFGNGANGNGANGNGANGNGANGNGANGNGLSDVSAPQYDAQGNLIHTGNGKDVTLNQSNQDALDRERQNRDMRTSKMIEMMKKLQTAWMPTEMPQVISFKAKQKKNTQNGSSSSPNVHKAPVTAAKPKPSQNNNHKNEKPYIRAGEVLYAYNKLEVNSDYSGPVVLIGLDKRIRDAVIIADSFQPHDVALTIHPKSMAFADKTININAYILNPSTEATVVASEVDHHYFERWGSFVLVEAMTAYAGIVNAMGQAATVGAVPLVGQNQTAAIPQAGGILTGPPTFSPSQQGWMIAGKTLGKLSSIVRKNINRKNTIYLHKNDTVSILFMEDIYYTPNNKNGSSSHSNIDVNALNH